MKKHIVSLWAISCLVLFCVQTAFAQPASLPVGTKVTITDIHKEDSYFNDKTRFIGKTGEVINNPLTTSSIGRGWYSGAVKIDGESSSNYFYAISVKIGDTPAPDTKQSVAGKSTAATIPAGKAVVIVDISEEDAYFDQKDALVGKTGKVSEGLKTSSAGKGWYGGEVVMDGGLGSKYFYAVALSTDGIPAQIATAPKTLTDRATAPSIPKGTSVVVVDISPEDSYYRSKDMLIGKSGIISEGLTTSGEGRGWYSGEVTMGDGLGSKYFYAVAVSDGNKSANTALVKNIERETAATIPEGSTVMILAVSPEDAYYDDRETIEGKIGKALETLTLSDMGDGWYGGEVILDGESDSFYFYAVSVKVIKK
jgi:hypothetical protein